MRCCVYSHRPYGRPPRLLAQLLRCCWLSQVARTVASSMLSCLLSKPRCSVGLLILSIIRSNSDECSLNFLIFMAADCCLAGHVGFRRCHDSAGFSVAMRGSRSSSSVGLDSLHYGLRSHHSQHRPCPTAQTGMQPKGLRTIESHLLALPLLQLTKVRDRGSDRALNARVEIHMTLSKLTY